MLKTLENLQNGVLTSKSYEYAVTNQRIVNISLSNYVTLERFHTAPVNAMDLDRIEERFLISGAKNGGICIHDLQNTTGKASYEAKVVCENPRFWVPPWCRFWCASDQPSCISVPELCSLVICTIPYLYV